MAISRMLVAHNRYRWPGGEDLVVADEIQLLRSAGIEVGEHYADNSEILQQGKLATLRTLWRAAWSKPSYRAMQQRLKETRPQLMHAHNLWFMLTPSILSACHDQGVPVVLTLHNFRLFCAAGVLLDRHGNACLDCLEQGIWTGVFRKCYHEGYLPSLAVVRMQSYNRKRGTWLKEVDRFLVPSKFCRELFIRFGLPAGKVIYKPHSVNDPLKGAHDFPPLPNPPRVLYLGRLSREKGLPTLLAAWRTLAAHPDAELRIVGDGPLREELEKSAAGMRVSFPGKLPAEAIPGEIRAATLVVLPSDCYETYGRVVIEAWAGGRPVVVSDRGGPAELVNQSGAGLVFAPGEADELAEKLASLLADEKLCAELGARGREYYLQHHTPEANLKSLLNIYGELLPS